MLGGIWAVYLAQTFVGGSDFGRLGVLPRSAWGLIGVVCMPLVHLSLGHLLVNTASLAILLLLLPRAATRWRGLFLADWLLGGAMLWVFGSARLYVGASALVFGLIGSLLVVGWLRQRLLLFSAAIGVAACYALPTLASILWFRWPDVAREPPLYGVLSGVLVGAVFTRLAVRRSVSPDA